MRGEFEVASDPAGSHQRGDGDGKDLDGIAKAERLGEAFHGALKRMRGQSSGDEVDVLTAKGIVTLHGNPSLSPLTPLSRVIAESSVDVDHLAVEKVGIGGGKEADDLGDIVGGSPPPCERLLGGSPVPLVRSRATPVGLNPAWRDAVDAHTGSQRLGETSREGGHSGFDGGEHLSRVSFHPLVGLVPSESHDGGASRAAERLHAPTDFSAAFDGASDIDLPKPLKFRMEIPIGGRAGQNIGAGDV